MGFIEEAGPIEGREDDGRAIGEKDEATEEQGIFNGLSGGDPTAAEGVAEGWRDIEAEGGEVKIHREDDRREGCVVRRWVSF
jgi:hypothetical protein